MSISQHGYWQPPGIVNPDRRSYPEHHPCAKLIPIDCPHVAGTYRRLAIHSINTTTTTTNITFGSQHMSIAQIEYPETNCG